MNQLRELTEEIGGTVLESVGRAVGKAQERTPLPVDLLESEDAYLAVFDAPDATASDVQVQLSGRTVEVRLDRFRQPREDFEMRFPGRGLTLDGHVTLPPDAAIDGEGATATLAENGTLQVRVPKGEEGTAVEVTDDDGETESEDSDAEDDESESDEVDVDDETA
ncbi:HSP20 type chaperone protein [Halorhabdus tiamatea SARL4B]|uniref:Hsp20 type chaperone n=1 Tax=Halorhabdus tiamatea SARL4B TaxID=1033806 RepID=F7PQC1_9EURY|nr:Hsp20 family protein [Halorhabdus tiamatea]ERJ06122.1 HSP20 type chaperone protein [Halorhabdus tiamatea SARL4B]CCQ33250.1 hsp20 type chaperone [Halorhabdus tiamatea SARL4B]